MRLQNKFQNGLNCAAQISKLWLNLLNMSWPAVQSVWSSDRDRFSTKRMRFRLEGGKKSGIGVIYKLTRAFFLLLQEATPSSTSWGPTESNR